MILSHATQQHYLLVNQWFYKFDFLWQGQNNHHELYSVVYKCLKKQNTSENYELLILFLSDVVWEVNIIKCNDLEDVI